MQAVRRTVASAKLKKNQNDNNNNNNINNNNTVQAVRRTVTSAKLKKNQAHARLYQKSQTALGAAKVRRLHRAVPRV